jgi:SAM-dependent methyltransferase
MMLKLDLGAGERSPAGFTPLGREHHGSEIYPLPYADGTVDEIRASHCLEHFPHRLVPVVFKDWVRALKPGGRIRIAVPDFTLVAQGYLEGKQQPTEWYVCGAQADANDFHHAIFDYDRLRQLFAGENLCLVERWISDIDDCAAYPISLNLQGVKPRRPAIKVSGAMSVPRLGFMDNFFCAMEAVLACQVKFRKHGGAFWGQAMENCLENILAEDDADYILTMDYDSVFLPKHLARMMQILCVDPSIDALAPVQSSRHIKTTLFTVRDGEGGNAPRLARTDFDGETKGDLATAHFGLTLLKAAKLKALPKPWFHSIPSENGDWRDGHIDDDISFWHKWRAAGNNIHLACRVPIGHAELMVRWPDINLELLLQDMKDFHTTGVPDGAWR